MKIINNILATALIVGSLYIVLFPSLFVLYGPKIMGSLFEVAFMGGEINPETFQLETSFGRVLTAFIFAAFAYHVIFRFAFYFIEALAMKIASSVIVLFFLFSNMPAEVLQIFNANLLSWSIYLLSLGILGYYLWGRKEDLELDKMMRFLKQKSSSGG